MKVLAVLLLLKFVYFSCATNEIVQPTINNLQLSNSETPRTKKNITDQIVRAKVVMDQRQTGQLNIHLTIKDLTIISLNQDGLKQSSNNRDESEDYYYDDNDYTVKPISISFMPSSTNAPTNSDSTQNSHIPNSDITSIGGLPVQPSLLDILLSLGLQKNESETDILGEPIEPSTTTITPKKSSVTILSPEPTTVVEINPQKLRFNVENQFSSKISQQHPSVERHYNQPDQLRSSVSSLSKPSTIGTDFKVKTSDTLESPIVHLFYRNNDSRRDDVRKYCHGQEHNDNKECRHKRSAFVNKILDVLTHLQRFQ